jgi:hypothetical protein
MNVPVLKIGRWLVRPDVRRTAGIALLVQQSRIAAHFHRESDNPTVIYMEGHDVSTTRDSPALRFPVLRFPAIAECLFLDRVNQSHDANQP